MMMSGIKSHSVLAEDKRYETMLVTPMVVAKWLAKAKICSTSCCTELMLGCPKIVSSEMAYIYPLTISVMAFTVAMIAVMIALFKSNK